MFALGTPQDFWIELLDGGSYRLGNHLGPCSFSRPASTPGIPKLYTLSDSSQLIYVGYAIRRMSERLGTGFRATGESGYHGYKWQSLRHRLALSVWEVKIPSRVVTVGELETIEAEVVFLCRLQSGQWPRFQHEIHFHVSEQGHREAAKTIFEHAISKQ